MKRFIKAVSIALALVLLLPVIVLGCTDDDKPRKLDGIEESIVGKWEIEEYGGIFTFKDDGTYEFSAGGTGEFKHVGSGVEDGENGRGHYEIIYFSGVKHTLFNNDSDTMYGYNENKNAPTPNVRVRRVIDEE